MLNGRWIFQEFSEQEDESQREFAILGGITEGTYDLWSIAEAFKATGDILVNKVISGHLEAYELIHPILYNYRHSLELYLKFILKPTKLNHDLKSLLENFQKYIKVNYGIEVPQMYKDVVLELHDFDERSTTFRYGLQVISTRGGDSGEFKVDLLRLSKIMNLFQVSFRKITKAGNII